jgi:hypothetical protein
MGIDPGMEQPAVFGLVIVGTTFLLFVILAWATATDRDVRDSFRAHRSSGPSTQHPEMKKQIERACPLCGVHVPSKQDAAVCPVIEAFGIVMAESKRAITEGPTPP